MTSSAEGWAARILEGDVRALARAASAVENGRPEAARLLELLAPHAGRARVVGITGAPGAGKSSLVDGLTRQLRREGRSVGIVAVDPSSPYTGGAILGDRIRMQGYHDDSGVFIRSMSSRGRLGGLAAATASLVRLLEAAGKEFVLVETVGVGQDEIEVARLGGVTVVVLAPGMGDPVQALKAGILEIADIFVVNKADRAGAGQLERELIELASLAGGAATPVVRTVATEDAGLAELLAAIRAHRPARARRLPAPREYAIDHVGIAVRSIDRALEFYEGKLGMRAAGRESLAAEKVDVAMLPASGARVELIEPSAAESPVAKFLDRRGEGLHHVALAVPDLQAVVAQLSSAGARLLNEPRTGAGGRRYVFVHPASTGGVLLELIQREQEFEN